jgi:hypothetical protein
MSVLSAINFTWPLISLQNIDFQILFMKLEYVSIDIEAKLIIIYNTYAGDNIIIIIIIIIIEFL